MSRRPLVVVLDGPPTPAWQARALSLMEQSPQFRVIETRLLGPVRVGAWERMLATIERRIFGGRDALAPTRLPAVADGPSQQPDALVVWLSERPPPADEPRDLLHLRHDRAAVSAAAAVGRAVVDDAATVETEAVLRRGDAELLVDRTVSGVRPYSALVTRDLMLWKLASFASRAVERAPRADRPAAPPRSLAPPSARSASSHALVAWTRVVVTRVLFQRPWSIRVRRRRDDPTGGWTGGDEGLVRWGDSPVYADPFLFEHEGRHHLFCEEVPSGSRRGVISHTELAPDGSPAAPPTVVLEAEHHLSYPFVFRHAGELFMVPETSAARRVALYRAVDFPRVWAFEAELLADVAASDATIVEHDGRFWLFAAIAAPDASSLDELHLFWADELRGPWNPHPRNPVVSDVRGARPAGAVQRRGERLVRPAQDGSRRYGWAISFREIDVLTTTEYAEHEIDRIEPAGLGGARATHHYTTDGSFEAIDYRRRWLRRGSRGRR